MATGLLPSCSHATAAAMEPRIEATAGDCVATSASVAYDPATGLGHAGGYVGSGLTATNLAGRTLRDLVLGHGTDLTRLPWTGHRVRRWEPEPLRWAETLSRPRAPLLQSHRT